MLIAGIEFKETSKLTSSKQLVKMSRDNTAVIVVFALLIVKAEGVSILTSSWKYVTSKSISSWLPFISASKAVKSIVRLSSPISEQKSVFSGWNAIKWSASWRKKNPTEKHFAPSVFSILKNKNCSKSFKGNAVGSVS